MTCGVDESLLASVAAGAQRLTDEQALALLDPAVPLSALGAAAHAVRQRLHPAPRLTYIIDRNINYTNVCTTGCAFCAFSRSSSAPDAWVIARDVLHQKVHQLRDAGGNLVLLQGGHHPDLPLQWYVALLRDLKERFPGLHIHAFSPPEIVDFSNRFARPVAEILRILRDAGLDSLPGGGAEILSDRVRRLVSPRKATASQWIEVMRIAHALGLRSSATMMFGHAETLAERVETLRRLRDLQDQTRGFTAFACWGWQPDNTPAARRLQGAEACRRLERRIRSGPVGAAEYLRTLAVSRLYLDNVANIQVSCVTLGADVGQLAMQFGGNDWGGIMLEENVVREAGTVHSVRVEDLRRRSEELGYSLCRRNFFYELTE